MTSEIDLQSLEFTEHSVDDTVRIDAARCEGWVLRCSPINGDINGVIVFYHGLAEHPARHLTLARRLAAHGIVTVLPSLPGHAFDQLPEPIVARAVNAYARVGSASEIRERILSFRIDEVQHAMSALQIDLASIDMDTTLRQIRRFHAQARAMHQGCARVFLGGMSLGGLLALAATMTKDEDIQPGGDHPSGLLLINPALAPTGPPRSTLQRWAVRALWRLRRADVPVKPLLWLITLLVSDVDVRWVSQYVSDLPAEQELQASDPFVHQSIPARYLVSIQDLMLRVHRCGLLLRTPCLVCLSERDVIVDPGGTRLFIDRHAGRSDSCLESLVCAEQISHELLRSSDAPAAFSRIESWVKRYLGD